MSSLSSSVEAQIRIKSPHMHQLQCSLPWVADAALCTVRPHWPTVLHDINLREIFEYAHLKFTVSGRCKHTHTRAQCSHASVGLAQARPNDVYTHFAVESNPLCFQKPWLRNVIKCTLNEPVKRTKLMFSTIQLSFVWGSASVCHNKTTSKLSLTSSKI